MTRAFQALTAEPWAIEPSWLPLIAALSRRDYAASEIAAAGDWQKRDYQMMAGPGAQRLAGTQRAFVSGGVAIIPVTGPIFPRANMMTEMSGATSISMLHNDFRAAMQAGDIGAIMLLVDSPGGAVAGVNSFADAVAAGAKKKPVTAYVSGSAASAAYWIASAANEIVVDRTGVVGSIGVVAARPVQVEPDANGEMTLEIVSTNAPNKRPDPSSEEGRAEIVAMLDAIEKLFVSDVARGRKVSTSKVLADFGRGGVKVGADGVAAGMADRVQSYDATLAAMQRAAANARKLAELKR